MKRELFFVLLVIIGLLLWQYSIDKQDYESFQNAVMPKQKTEAKSVDDGPLPFSSLSASSFGSPPGQTESVDISYNFDNKSKKVDLERITKVLETLNGFLKNDASSISKLNDPSIQIPMQTAQADVRRLTDEISVMKLNKGAESTLSEENIHDIDANLRYLQKNAQIYSNSTRGGVEGFQAEPSGMPSGNTNSTQRTFTYKGFKSDYSSLPSMNNTVGDIYYLPYIYFTVMVFVVWLPPADNLVRDMSLIGLKDTSSYTNPTFTEIKGTNIVSTPSWTFVGLPRFNICSVSSTFKDAISKIKSDVSKSNFSGNAEVYKIEEKLGPYFMYIILLGFNGGINTTNIDFPNLTHVLNKTWINETMPGKDPRIDNNGRLALKKLSGDELKSSALNWPLYKSYNKWDTLPNFQLLLTDIDITKNISLNDIPSELQFVLSDASLGLSDSEKLEIIASYKFDKFMGDVIKNYKPSVYDGLDPSVMPPIPTVMSLSKLPLSGTTGDRYSIDISDDISFFAIKKGINTQNSWIMDLPITYTTETYIRSSTVGLEGFQNNNLGISASILTQLENIMNLINNLENTRRPSGMPSGPSGMPSGPLGSLGPTDNNNRITYTQLLNLQTKLFATIKALTESGSTNPKTSTRITELQDILEKINSFILKIKNGTMDIKDIPITVENYNKFLKFVDPSNLIINQALPILIDSEDEEWSFGLDSIRRFFGRYGNELVNETSYDVKLNLNHKSASERKIAENESKMKLNPLLNPNYPREGDNNGNSNNNNNSNSNSNGNNYGSAPPSSGSRGETEDLTSKNGPVHNSSAPAIMNWKERSRQICEQISKRGLNPDDYGCLKDSTPVAENFSFRGHTRMVCSRLGTNYDPGIPELCGCPPPTWPGWRP